MKRVIKGFYSMFLCIFKIPESFIAFFSGILVSASINIFTSVIPKSTEALPWNVMLSALLMLLSSFFLMAWASIVKPCQQKYDEDAPNERNWGVRLKANSNDKKLIVLFLLSFLFCAGSIYLILR